MTAETLASLIGQDLDAAAMYLEMAGGDLDTAVSLYFETAGDGNAFGASTDRLTEPASNRPDWLSLVWPQLDAPLPAAWADQTLTFDRGLCLTQLKNGPCGVIAAWQAVVIAACHRRRIANFFSQGPHFKPPPALLASALADLLRCCLPSTDSGDGTNGATHESAIVRVCYWAPEKGSEDSKSSGSSSMGDGSAVKVIELDVAALESQSEPPRSGRDTRNDALAVALEPLLPGLLDVPGACALLVYSALLTRGAAGVRNDMAGAGTDAGATLVTGPMSLCSLELVSLLLAGRAHGHCLAYHPLTRVRHLAWVRPDALSSSSTTKSGRMSGEGAATAAAPGHASSSNGLTLSGGSGAEVTHGMNSSGKRIGTQDDNDDDATAEVKAPPPSSESSSLGVGFLSVAEKEAGQPIADDLKSPTTPVWVLHGGDHFTVLFDCHPPGTLHADAQPLHQTEAQADAATAPVSNDSSVAAPAVPVIWPGDESCEYPLVAGEWRGPATLWHWNGLPPAGPRLTALTVTGPSTGSESTGGDGGVGSGEIGAMRGSTTTPTSGKSVLSVAKPAPSQLSETHVKPRKGQIEDVVQARPADKAARPFDVSSWTFEVVLADPEQDEDEKEKGHSGDGSNRDAANSGGDISSTNDSDTLAAADMDVDSTVKEKKEIGKVSDEMATTKALALTQVANADGVFQQEAFSFSDVFLKDGDTSPTSDGIWRCRHCYATRFKSFCFGINHPTAPALDNEGGGDAVDSFTTAPSLDAAAECVHCGILRSVGGWSVWMPYSSLTPAWQAAVASRYGPPITGLLRSKWPNCEVAIGLGGHGDRDNAAADKFPTV